jgi:hypothetical protein
VVAKENHLKSQLDDAMESGDTDLAVERARALVKFKVRTALQVRAADLLDGVDAGECDVTAERARDTPNRLWAFGIKMAASAAGISIIFFGMHGYSAEPISAIRSAVGTVKAIAANLSDRTHPSGRVRPAIYGALDSGGIRESLASAVALSAFARLDAYSPPYLGLVLPSLPTSLESAEAEWAMSVGKAHLMELFRRKGFEAQPPTSVWVAQAGQIGPTCSQDQPSRTLKTRSCKGDAPSYSRSPETMFYSASPGGMPIYSAAWSARDTRGRW